MVGPATLAHETRFECQKLKVFARFVGPAATVGRERRFERQKLSFFPTLVCPAATFSHEMMFECQKLRFFFFWGEFGWYDCNPFERNDA